MAGTIVHTERIAEFAMAMLQWRTVAHFRDHLRGYYAAEVAPWVRGVTLHHTVIPTTAQWRGAASMLAMARFYRGTRNWRAGPHLYVVNGAPDPRHDGIWQLTPLNTPGVHAAAYNHTHWGLEVVGSYDSLRWDAGTAALTLGTLAALHDWAGWAGVTSASLNAHRDDPATDKPCPGAAIDMRAVRRGVVALREGTL